MLDVLFWGLNASPVAWTSFNFLSLKRKKDFRLYFSYFWSSKPWIRNKIQIRTRIHLKAGSGFVSGSDSMNPDPQHWTQHNKMKEVSQEGRRKSFKREQLKNIMGEARKKSSVLSSEYKIVFWGPNREYSGILHSLVWTTMYQMNDQVFRSILNHSWKKVRYEFLATYVLCTHVPSIHLFKRALVFYSWMNSGIYVNKKPVCFVLAGQTPCPSSSDDSITWSQDPKRYQSVGDAATAACGIRSKLLSFIFNLIVFFNFLLIWLHTRIVLQYSTKDLYVIAFVVADKDPWILNPELRDPWGQLITDPAESGSGSYSDIFVFIDKNILLNW